MKKWLSFLLALCMLLSLTACGNESGGPSGNPSEPKSPTDVEVELTEPVTITFWHGIVQENMQQTLNEIVDDFNKGIGAEKGITMPRVRCPIWKTPSPLLSKLVICPTSP